MNAAFLHGRGSTLSVSCVVFVLPLLEMIVRVAHRRSMMTRTKYIHDIRIDPINAHFFHLYLTTSAGTTLCVESCRSGSVVDCTLHCALSGTYVKEFVHGDLGRTTPSIGSLLVSLSAREC